MAATTDLMLSTEEKLKRLAAATAALATEMDRRDDEEPRMSAEEQVERILYVEHFTWTHVPEGGLW